MNLKHDGPLSSFAFNCNLRHYSKGHWADYIDPCSGLSMVG